MPAKQPNILILMTDQQRYDSLGCYGASFAHTPNLDRLAGEGVVFERCYANNPICTPSRASMMTGKHLPGHGVYRLYDNLPLDEVLFPARLQALGYTTALFGKLHVSSIETESYERHPNDGFDVYEPCLEGCLRMDAPYQAYAQWLKEVDPEFHDRLDREGRKLLHPPRDRHMTYWAAERTMAYLENNAASNGDKPFFCMMSIFEPHNPYEHYPKEMESLVDPAKVPDPQPRPADLKDEPSGIERERHGCHLGDIDSFSAEALRKMRDGYHTAVAYADFEFGRVLDTLEKTGLADNTLVLFTSDHGDMLGDRGLLVKGAHFYEGNVHVPLLMRWPNRLPASARTAGLVQLNDIAATVLAAAGMEPDEREAVMPGARDLSPLARGECGEVHDVAVCCYRNSGMNRDGAYWDPPMHATMIRDARYKLNVWHGEAGHPSEGELYDMECDPLETQNLWNDPASQLVRMRLSERLTDWMNKQERLRGSRGGQTLPRRPVHSLKTTS